jgi:hypothetical protein
MPVEAAVEAPVPLTAPGVDSIGTMEPMDGSPEDIKRRRTEQESHVMTSMDDIIVDDVHMPSDILSGAVNVSNSIPALLVWSEEMVRVQGGILHVNMLQVELK